MTQYKHRRATVTTHVPGTILPGEIAVNLPDGKLWVGDAGGTRQELLGVKPFLTTATYALHDLVAVGGNIYSANGAVSPGTFNSSQWTQITAPPGTILDLVINATQSLTTTPTGNPGSTKSSFSVQGATASPTAREFLVNIGLNITEGELATGADRDKVAAYIGATMGAGAGDGWAMNTVMTLNAGTPATSSAQGWELDFNNLAGHRGDAAGGAGLSAPVTYGLSITGVGSYRNTAALLVSGPGTNTIWNRGIAFANDSIRLATLADYTNSNVSYEVAGNHTYGIDLKAGVYAAGAIRLPNNAYLIARNGADTADLKTIGQVGDAVLLGDVAGTATYSVNHFIPFTNNTHVLGNSSNKWVEVWATNGTIQTSDITLKIHIQTLGTVDTGKIIDRIKPITYEWKDLSDTRTHWGFSAQDCAYISELSGRDFGGHIVADDGTQSLRPDQLVPIAWEELRRLRKRVLELEARLGG